MPGNPQTTSVVIALVIVGSTAGGGAILRSVSAEDRPVIEETGETAEMLETPEDLTLETTPPIVATPAETPAELDTVVDDDGGTVEGNGAVPLSGLVPARITASASAPTATGSGGQRISYGPYNAFDGRRETAWCVEGDGVGDYLKFTFERVVEVTEVAMIPGYDKVDEEAGADRWEENRRIITVEFAFAGGTPYRTRFSEPLRELKSTRFPTPIETKFLWIAPRRTTPPGTRDYTCISEVVLYGNG